MPGSDFDSSTAESGATVVDIARALGTARETRARDDGTVRAVGRAPREIIRETSMMSGDWIGSWDAARARNGRISCSEAGGKKYRCIGYIFQMGFSIARRFPAWA